MEASLSPHTTQRQEYYRHELSYPLVKQKRTEKPGLAYSTAGLGSPFLEAVHKEQHYDLGKNFLSMHFTQTKLSKGPYNSHIAQMRQEMVTCSMKKPNQTPAPFHNAACSRKGVTSPWSFPGAGTTLAWAAKSTTNKTKSITAKTKSMSQSGSCKCIQLAKCNSGLRHMLGMETTGRWGGCVCAWTHCPTLDMWKRGERRNTDKRTLKWFIMSEFYYVCLTVISLIR